MSLEACARLVERGDPDRFRAAMAAPPAARAVLFPVYAFNLEVARAPWVTQEPLLAEIRLQWWRDTVEGEARAHEVAAPLLAAIGAGVPREPLLRVIDARRRDVSREPFGSLDELRGYLQGTGGGLTWATVAGLGSDAREAAEGVGFAGGVAAFLLALPQLRARGVGPVEGLDLTPLATEGLALIAQARRARVGPGAPALRAQWWAEGVLRRAAAGRADLAPSEASKRLSLAWRALRGAW